MLGAGVHLLLSLGVALAATCVLRGLGNPWALASLFPSLALFLVLGWSLSALSGLAFVHFRDTQYLFELGFQALFYLTPILYSPDNLGNGRLATIMRYHPLVPCLRLVREPLVDGRVPGLTTFAGAGITTLLAAAAAVWALRRLERGLVYRM